MKYIIKITQISAPEEGSKYPKQTDIYVQEVEIDNEIKLLLPVIKAVNGI